MQLPQPVSTLLADKKECPGLSKVSIHLVEMYFISNVRLHLRLLELASVMLSLF